MTSPFSICPEPCLESRKDHIERFQIHILLSCRPGFESMGQIREMLRIDRRHGGCVIGFCGRRKERRPVSELLDRFQQYGMRFRRVGTGRQRMFVSGQHQLPREKSQQQGRRVRMTHGNAARGETQLDRSRLPVVGPGILFPIDLVEQRARDLRQQFVLVPKVMVQGRGADIHFLGEGAQAQSFQPFTVDKFQRLLYCRITRDQRLVGLPAFPEEPLRCAGFSAPFTLFIFAIAPFRRRSLFLCMVCLMAKG